MTDRDGEAEGTERTNSEKARGMTCVRGGFGVRSRDALERIDFDIDPGSEVAERLGSGPADPGGRQERLVEGEDFGRLKRIRFVVHPTLVEAVVSQGIE